eukprot:TRINITY_DN7310_c0_g1_i6.p2 TRINITY_DN7310_c0_g1~~TRINITY_DN7310_c0_g1_i6.p2  ORF type:complete len:247 (-),score=46.22 TRINITY_DN7310_c0_g1_i6:166-906(-)
MALPAMASPGPTIGQFGMQLSLPMGQNPGDWTCQFCKAPQFSRNISCRACGSSRPIAGQYGTPLPQSSSTAISLLESPTGQPGDWTCPRCKGICFARNPFCGRCNCPKPESEAEAAALAKGAGIPGMPASQQVAADPNSSWARQWNAGPANGMFVGETELPDWLTGVGVPDEEKKDTSKKSDSSDSSSDRSTAKAKKKPKAKAKRKVSKKYAGLTKDEIKKKKAEEEEKKRDEMRERRKGRIISVD